MSANFIELFSGLMKGVIPFDQNGFILSARFDTHSNYTIFEIIAFGNVKNIAQTSDGVTFHSDGFKTFILYEPVTYRFRFQEPYIRDREFQIPLRWKELHTVDLPSHDRIHITKEPYMSYGSFTIDKPDEGNFVYYFYDSESFQTNIENFLSNVLRKDLKVPQSISREVNRYVQENLQMFRKSSD